LHKAKHVSTSFTRSIASHEKSWNILAQASEGVTTRRLVSTQATSPSVECSSYSISPRRHKANLGPLLACASRSMDCVQLGKNRSSYLHSGSATTRFPFWSVFGLPLHSRILPILFQVRVPSYTRDRDEALSLLVRVGVQSVPASKVRSTPRGGLNFVLHDIKSNRKNPDALSNS